MSDSIEAFIKGGVARGLIDPNNQYGFTGPKHKFSFYGPKPRFGHPKNYEIYVPAYSDPFTYPLGLISFLSYAHEQSQLELFSDQVTHHTSLTEFNMESACWINTKQTPKGHLRWGSSVLDWFALAMDAPSCANGLPTHLIGLKTYLQIMGHDPNKIWVPKKEVAMEVVE